MAPPLMPMNVTFEELKAKALQRPEVRAEYERLRPEFERVMREFVFWDCLSAADRGDPTIFSSRIDGYLMVGVEAVDES